MCSIQSVLTVFSDIGFYKGKIFSIVQYICFFLQVLLTLPPAARHDYFPLLSDPLLMLEQLLMNLKVDWADVAVQTLRNLVVSQEAGFSAEDIDKLLEAYASKALDFSCAPRERSRSGQYRAYFNI